MPSNKETIYIDIDDEITTIIDKVKSSSAKITALVLPKRPTALQSIVNMRLLKRAADDSNKKVVLISSDSSVLPMAGLAGIHVAKSLQSKPEVPQAPVPVTDDNIDQTKSVGELADEEAIPVNNDDKEAVGESASKTATGIAAIKNTRKKIKIPNFDKFRVKLVLAVLVLLMLIGGLVWATKVAPRASITVKTATNNVASELQLVVNPDATELNLEEGVLPGEVREVSKSEKETVPATGEKNVGKKAKGSVTLSVACDQVEDYPLTVPEGTGVSTNNLTFITSEDITLATVQGSGGCSFTGEGDVAAQNAGEQYNIESGKIFIVAGYSSVSGTNDDAFSGGTNEIIKVVSEEDVEKAKAKITDRSDAARDELLQEMERLGLVGLRESFQTKNEPSYRAAPEVGEESDSVTVASSATYTMLGFNRDDLKKLVEQDVQDKIDSSKQVILDDGIDEATVILTDQRPNGEARITVRLTVLAGPQLDESSIKSAVAGKKKGQAMSDVKARPGIDEVEIEYKPFWVSVTPRDENKINVVFEQSSAQDVQ